MKKIIYFAYGSNMFSSRLQKRCASAKPFGIAKAIGYAFIYGKISKDGSSKATLVSEINSEAYGVLFEIDETDLPELDKAEGSGFGYNRENSLAVIDVSTGNKFSAITYLAPSNYIDRTLRPFDWYHALIVAGAKQHGLPESYIEIIRQAGLDLEIDRSSKGAQEALALLSAAGVSLSSN